MTGIQVASFSNGFPRCYFRTKYKRQTLFRSCRCEDAATQLVEINGLTLKLCEVHADGAVKKRYRVVVRNRRVQFQELKMQAAA